jgi:hypothetical protein
LEKRKVGWEFLVRKTYLRGKGANTFLWIFTGKVLNSLRGLSKPPFFSLSYVSSFLLGVLEGQNQNIEESERFP